MRAILKARPDRGLAIGEVPDPPPPGPGEVLIRVERGAICGTDLHIYKWDAWARGRIKPPLVVGHEFAGRVAAVGEGVSGFTTGQKVSAEGHLVCGICALCRSGRAHICPKTRIIGVDVAGAFAEFIAMPAENVWRIDEEVSIDVAAIHDPLGNAFHATLVAPVAGKSVLVEGCGPIGLFAIQIARAAGAAAVFAVDVNDKRLGLARDMGATRVLNAMRDPVEEAVRRETDGGVDVVLEMSGHPAAVRQGFALVANGGDVRLLGIPASEVPLDLAHAIIFKGITVYGIIGRRMYETWEQMRRYLREKRIDPTPVITHRLPYTEIEKGLSLIESGEAGKVVLIFGGET